MHGHGQDMAMAVDMAAGRLRSRGRTRRRKAMKKMDALRKKGVDIQPVTIEGRKIATQFLGRGLVRAPGVVQRLREPLAARPHLRPQRLGLPLGRRQGPDRGQGFRIGTLHRQGQHQDLAGQEVDRRSRGGAAGKSARSWNCSRASFPTT